MTDLIEFKKIKREYIIVCQQIKKLPRNPQIAKADSGRNRKFQQTYNK